MEIAKWFFTILLVMFYISPAFAQHEHHSHTPTHTYSSQQDQDQIITDNMDMKHKTSMTSSILLTVPMQRDGSGTSWLTDITNMHAYHGKFGQWSMMFHGNVFPRYTSQDMTNSGKRGESDFGSPNWVMAMGQCPISHNGQIALRVMLSLDRLTEGGDGYPLLFQTGESWNNEPLVDRQHPHDLFAELAVAYSHRIGGNSCIFAYFGLPGEPALGPPAFMHRPSAQNNPDAPLGHHWQDATHIIFGVATLGLQHKQFKLDGSIFTGREPDENRFDIDKPRFDSYSIRLSINPLPSLAFQISQGFLKSPEALEPDVDVWRTTSSIIYDKIINSENIWSTTLLWGLNKPKIHDSHTSGHSDKAQNSFLAESNLQINSNSIYARFESVQKPSEELNIYEFKDRIFVINAFTIGLSRKLIALKGLSFGVGAQGTAYFFDRVLQSFYGSRPLSGQIYLRISPVMIKMNNHKH